MSTSVINLDQVRAAAALKAAGEDSYTRGDVAGFPALIMQNGLLAAFAFAIEGGDAPRRRGLTFACDRAAAHLGNSMHGITVLAGVTNALGVISRLSEKGDSSDLQRATAETLAFFSYLKRFAK